MFRNPNTDATSSRPMGTSSQRQIRRIADVNNAVAMNWHLSHLLSFWELCRNSRPAMPGKIDPITRAVVQHRLSAIVAEMGEAMLRTSYSQILNSSRDFSLAICDVQSRLIAQADHIPVHVGALPWATRAVEARFSDVAPGDVILMNDPYHGGSHLPDITVFVPVFDNVRRRFGTIVR